MSVKTAAWTIEVKLKADLADAEGQSALSLLQGLGVLTTRACRATRLYELRCGLNAAQLQQVARELLCDPITQDFRVVPGGARPPVLNGMTHWRVEVWPKGSVADPAGETVRSAIAEMGLPQPERVRVGTAYLISGRCGRGQLEKAVVRGLANPVVHDAAVTESHP
ncbi:MAG: phosphoribosylformylglycinamidine synthase subunit PurS [Elusimicrobia bacterium]|nr:phosphoribosylformylglycinamidine synthase subunit PurS [Elusimicrobiota bacterium]MDE2425202.1 phosphoribosylformylglycinamidine synthase subunit PurS [Elusimicrobiota bacterium]